MATSSWQDARKSYLTSLRAKLKAAYRAELQSESSVDRRWLNGFMAAGFHSGLISLLELKTENMNAHRAAFGERMFDPQQLQLERRLTRLCRVD